MTALLPIGRRGVALGLATAGVAAFAPRAFAWSQAPDVAGLRHILDLEPDILKLDMGLTRDVHLDPARRGAMAAVCDTKDAGASAVWASSGTSS